MNIGKPAIEYLIGLQYHLGCGNDIIENMKQIASAIDNTEKITYDLKKILSKIESRKGTAGKLLTNDELYNKINNTVTNLNSLIKDIKEHPDEYLHISIF